MARPLTNGGAKPTRSQKKLTIRLDASLHKRCKLHCVDREVTLNDMVEDCIRAWLRRQDDRQAAGDR